MQLKDICFTVDFRYDSMLRFLFNVHFTNAPENDMNKKKSRSNDIKWYTLHYKVNYFIYSR